MTLPNSITPTRLRLALSISILLVVVAGVSVFYLAYTKLSETATEVGVHAANARESQDTLQRLQLLKKDLEAKRDVVGMTSRVMASSQNYAYQDLLVRDLTIYASRAHLTIKNINFSSPVSEAAPAAPADAANPAPAAPVGPKKATVDITLETPVDYTSLLDFLHYVEQNLTKLKISKVTITKGEANNVTIDVLNLEVYIQ